MKHAEIKRGDRWEQIGISEGIVLRDELMRCSACHGRVLVNRDWSSRSNSMFKHQRRSGTCAGKTSRPSERHVDAID
jgi:hypothetical protein